MPFECHFLVALMTLAGQTDARTWARGSLPDVFIRFSQRPLGQAAIPLTLTCGCVLTKWDGWDRHPLKQKSHSPAHTCADRRAPPNLSHTLQHVIYLMLIQPQHTHVTAALCPGQRIPNDFCFFPTISVSDYFSSVNVYADRPCHLTFISLSLSVFLQKNKDRVGRWHIRSEPWSSLYHSRSLSPTDSQIVLNDHSKALGQVKQERLSVMQEKDIYCNVASVGQNSFFRWYRLWLIPKMTFIWTPSGPSVWQVSISLE